MSIFLKLMLKMKVSYLIISILISTFVYAQNERKFIREGNKLYNDSNFEESEVSYRKAIDELPDSYSAAFNLGDALYKQGKFEEAANQFQALANKDLSKEELAKVYHNLGNSLLQSKDEKGQARLQESIDAYKQALRNNSEDLETKYNLSYAMRMLQQQQQQQQQNQDQNQDKNDDKQDQQNQDQQEQDKQDKQEQNQQQDQQDEQKQDQQQQQQPKEQEISKEDAQRMLEALQNDEKDAQEKLKKAQVKTQKVKIEKDW